MSDLFKDGDIYQICIFKYVFEIPAKCHDSQNHSRILIINIWLLDHKTSHRGKFYEIIWMAIIFEYLESEGANKNLNIEKITLLAMHITNTKIMICYIYIYIYTVLNIFMEHDLMIFGIK